MHSVHMRIRNFGRNLDFTPANYYEPASVNEVLDALRQSRGRQIRTIGKLHSWSEAPCSTDTIINLKNLRTAYIEEKDGQHFVRVAGGCQIKRVISILDQQGLALPSQGLITEQTIAGAISTGTHGTGKHSLSHYVVEIKVATFDQETGEPDVRTIRDGDELRAARCALGCLGVIVEVTLPCIQQYQVEEHWQFYDDLEEVRKLEKSYPIQQFFVLPHWWKILAQHRSVTSQNRSWHAPMFHLYWFSTIDLGLHLVLLFLSRLFKFSWAVAAFYKVLVPGTIITGWKVVDKSQLMLTMEHELFRHIECEIFVRRSQLQDYLAATRRMLDHFHGIEGAVSEEDWLELDQIGVGATAREMGGTYSHHYPICVRRILADDTLISMASGEGEDYYSVSFISYGLGEARDRFLRVAEVMTTIGTQLFNARPHWGKVCSLEPETAGRVYPRLKEFVEICQNADLAGQFRNDWIRSLMFEDLETKRASSKVV